MEEVMEIIEILEEAQLKGASDIHLAPGTQVMFRIDGKLVRMSDDIVPPYAIEKMLEPMLSKEQQAELERAGELDFAYSIPGFQRLRVNVFRQ